MKDFWLNSDRVSHCSTSSIVAAGQCCRIKSPGSDSSSQLSPRSRVGREKQTLCTVVVSKWQQGFPHKGIPAIMLD